MISESYKKYCCEDQSLIENYDKAISDTTQIWHCHHRGEVLPCGRFSPNDLNKFGLYFNRPAAELIFLTQTEHNRLHFKGVPRGPMSEATKKAISETLKGHSVGEVTKKSISEARSKKVLQLTKAGEFIREWPSAMEASHRLGIAQPSICICCLGKRKSASGFVWRYATNAKKICD